jgi:hypothetical protein
MADLILSNGREITFDLSKMTLRQYRGLFDIKKKAVEEDPIISAVSGLTIEEYLDLPHPDWKRLLAALFKKAREPLADPNSQSASIST